MSEIISSNEVLSQETQTETEILPFPESPPAEFVINPGKFKVLNIHKVRNEKRFEGKDMRDVAWEYIRCTNNIIRVIDGRDKRRDLVELDKDQKPLPFDKPDVVIYLDKSARPVSWFVRRFWSTMADKNAVKPETKFININVDEPMFEHIEDSDGDDKTTIVYHFDQWTNNEKEGEYTNMLLAIRAVFHRGELSESNWKDEVMDDEKSYLANKNILLVDEVKCEGRQMRLVQQLLKLTFPHTSVTGIYFWDSKFESVKDNPGKWQMHSVPAWFERKNVFGRGVAEKNPVYYSGSPNIRMKKGSFILSAPHLEVETQEDGKMVFKRPKPKDKYDKKKDNPNFDHKAVNLRKDINQLHQDYIESGVDKLLTQK